MLQIADLTFGIASATLVADISGGALSWAINIECVPKTVGGKRWRPRAFSDHLLQIEGWIVERWTDAFEHDIVWGENYDDEAEAPHANLDVFKPLDIFESRLRIAPSRGGSEIQIDWSARCQVFFDAQYGDNLNLEVHTAGTFDGVVVGEQGENLTNVEAERRLREHIGSGEFQFFPAQDPYMLPMMCPVAAAS